LYLSIPALAVAAGGYVANDYFDLVTDKISKPWRPLIRGDINPAIARRVSIFLYLFAVAYSIFFIGFLTTIFVILNVFIVDLYNSRFKREGFLGNIFVALATSNLFIYGSLSYAERLGGLDKFTSLAFIPYIFAFLLTLTREVIKGVEDVEGDRLANIKTLAVALGYRKSAVVTIILNLIIISILLIPYLYHASHLYLIFAIATVSLSLYSSYLIYSSRNEEEAIKKAVIGRSLTKISLLTGILAFLLWTI